MLIHGVRPGPLIMVTQFVGYLAAFRAPEPFSPLVAVVLGAARFEQRNDVRMLQIPRNLGFAKKSFGPALVRVQPIELLLSRARPRVPLLEQPPLSRFLVSALLDGRPAEFGFTATTAITPLMSFAGGDIGGARTKSGAPPLSRRYTLVRGWGRAAGRPSPRALRALGP